MVQIVICRSLLTLNVILNLLLYAVNINDFHVCVLLFFLDVQLPEAGFSRDGIFFLFFIRQSVIVFQEIELKKRKKRKKGRKREKERRRSTFPELSCFGK